ncbi:MAG: acetate--CoA ligase family protein [Desulfosalsimonadaceae bacterium]
MSLSFFHELMNPRSIAIVGASNNPSKMGTMHALSILKDGFIGKFFAVHPTETTVLGHPAYKSPLDLPEAPDLAMFVLPSKHLLPVFEAFGQIGTRFAIVITAGFKEAGEDGVRLEEQLKDTAKRYGIRFVGPNCMGIVNRDIGLNTSVSPITGKPGPLGLISQSGTYVAQTVDYLQKRGIRLGKAVSLGNEADINIMDVLEYMGEDPGTKAISMYIESIRDVDRFLKVARRITPHKPVVAQYIGGSEAGGRAGLSHTGSMAGKDYLYDGLFRQAGIIRVFSVEDLYGQGWALATQPRIRGNRIAIITNSGGPGSAIADTLDALGCKVPPFSDDLQASIKPLIPPHAPCGNPVDMTFALDMKIMTEAIPDLVLNSGEVDGVIMHGAMSTGFLTAVYPHLADLMPGVTCEDMVKGTIRDLSKTVQVPFKHNMPMTVSAFFDRCDQYTSEYEDHNVPVYDSPEKAARAMAALVQYQRIQNREIDVPLPELTPTDTALRILNEAKGNGQKALDEFSAKALLNSYGIPVARERLVHSPAEALDAASAIGFPVVVKACDADILHKTEQGLVHLNIRDADGLIHAYDAIQQSVKQSIGKPVAVLIGEMIRGEREFLAGITWDEQFGHCLAFGVGGIFTEAINDIRYRVAPVNEAEARAMIKDIKHPKLLSAFRKMPEVNMASLSKILSTLSMMPLLHPEIREIDINPLIISGAEPVAVDALVVMA